MSRQIEITVVCHIGNRVLITGTLIMNLHRILIGQCIGYFYIKVPRESLFAIRTEMMKYNGLSLYFGVPHHKFKTIRAAM